jgi:putative tryptophan/tyrosine transport system substrate-binding protein
MIAQIKRREFISLLGGAVAAWPVAAIGQGPGIPMVGYLYFGSPEASAKLTAAFRKGLSETGFVEGQNVAIEYRWARSDAERLPELARDLVGRRVAVIATPGSFAATLAVKAATATIPIVFETGRDPVEYGLVPSFNKPAGNMTGFTSMNMELMANVSGSCASCCRRQSVLPC